MREFSKISPMLWRSNRFQNLATDDAKLAFLYLLTCEHQNSAGAYRLPVGYAGHDLNWGSEKYENKLGELDEAGLVVWDKETEEIMICRWFKHNPPMNQKHRKGIVSTLERLDSEMLAEAVLADLDAAEPKEPNIVQDPKSAGSIADTKHSGDAS